MKSKSAKFLNLSSKVITNKCYFLGRIFRQSGFTLLEMMIVIAIVGILAAVSIPLYINYIQQSRIRTLVYSGLHVIETNITLHYAAYGVMPPRSKLPTLMREADTDYFNVDILGSTLKIVIDSPEGIRPLLTRFDNMPMYLTPVTNDVRISTWQLSGTLAERIGVSTK